MANETAIPDIFWLVIPARLDRNIPFNFRQKFPEIYDREVLETELFLIEQ